MGKKNRKFTPPYSSHSSPPPLNIFDRKHCVHFSKNGKTSLPFNFSYPI